MNRSTETVLWGIAGLLLVTFAIPWFLWGNNTIVAGLPIWVWWHIGWMALASVVFLVFTRRSWGLGVTSGEQA